MKFGSLFAGAGGFDLGFEGAGFECCWQVESDAFCQDVLSFRWPDVPKFGDIREVSGHELEPVDVITYGFPCQDLSFGGARSGLDGARSGLFFEAMRIIKEMRDATGGRFPRVAVAENVLGLLSADSGDAMGRCLDEMAKVGAVGVEWITLDARRFGVPQRRKRVFIASFFDSGVSGRCDGQLFASEEVGGGDSEEGEEQGEGFAGGVEVGGGEGCSVVSGPRFFTQSGFGFYSEGVGCLAATDHKRPNQHLVVDGDVIRKLTPKECERLMGWPDDHTRFGGSGGEISNMQRYRMCGNGVVSPVAMWVAERIRSVL